MPSSHLPADEDTHLLNRDALINRIDQLQTLLTQQSQRSLRTQEALYNSDQRLHTVLVTVPDAVIIINRHGIIQLINPAVTRLFGYTPAELLGQNVKLLMPSPHHERHDGYIQHYLDTGESHIIGKGREIVGRRKDGSLFPADLGLSEMHDGELYFVGIVRDLSERKRSEKHLRILRAQLEQMSRSAIAGELGAMLAHEINQPLMAAITYAQLSQQLLHNGNLDTAQVTTLLGRVVEQSKRAGSIIKRLRSLIQTTEPSFEAVPINEAIQEILHLLAPDLTAQHIAVHTQLAAVLPILHGDRLQIQQVLINLLRNSIDALKEVPEEQRELTLHTALHEGETVLIRISDTGTGLTPAIAKDLFKPFFTTKNNGIGLGLAICQSIIEHHGGLLWADPPAGRGAVFSFTLPVLVGENPNDSP